MGDQRWITGLARSLVRDAAAADDLVQDALTIAIQRPSLVLGDARSWASCVLKNLARDRSRSASRRAAREHDVAPAEGGVSDTSDLILAAERQRALMGAVLALAEPYKTVILLRWFEGLPPRAIAARTNTSTGTVSKQLVRAHARLRKELESEFGGEGAWAVALLPVIGSKSAKAGASGALKLLTLAVTAVLVVGSSIWVHGHRRTQGMASMGAGVVRPEAAPVGEALVGLSMSDGRIPSVAGREAGDRTGHAAHDGTPLRTGAVGSSVLLPDRWFCGRLMDVYGEPIELDLFPDLALRLEFNDALDALEGEDWVVLRPGTGGLFEDRRLSVYPSDLSKFHVVGADLAVLEVGYRSLTPEVMDVVLIEAIDLRGHVVDEEGTPVEGVQVSLRVDLEALGTYPIGLETSFSDLTRATRPKTSTDRDGRFTLNDVPANSLFDLRALSPDGRSATMRVPEASSYDVLMMLGEKKPLTEPIHGRVVFQGGGPVSGAKVDLGYETAVTGDDGSFTFELSKMQWDAFVRGDRTTVTALAPNGAFSIADAEPGASVTLLIPSQMGTLQGRLLDEEGRGVRGAQVTVYDGTRSGGRSTMMEMRGALDQGLGWPTTDAEGRFTLSNLLDRNYTLRFIGEDANLVFDVPGVRAGNELVSFQIPKGYRAPFEGRVLDIHGRPLSSVQVSLSAWMQHADGKPRSGGRRWLTSSDADGRFRIPSLSRAGAHLTFDNRPDDGWGGVEIQSADIAQPGPTDIHVDLGCDVEITLNGPGEAIQFLNSDGEPTMVKARIPRGMSHEQWIRPMGNGSFRPLVVRQSVSAVQVMAGPGEVLREVRLDLNPKKRNVIDL